MAIVGDAFPFGLREIKIVSGDTAISLPAAQTLKFMEQVTSAQLRGNDRVVVASSFVDAVSWELTNGGIPMEAYALMTGRTLEDGGALEAETRTMTISGGDAFPWFIIYGKSIGDAGDDVHVKLFKAKLTEGMDGTFADQNFYIASCKGIAVDDGTNGIADIVRNETAVALPEPA